MRLAFLCGILMTVLAFAGCAGAPKNSAQLAEQTASVEEALTEAARAMLDSDAESALGTLELGGHLVLLEIGLRDRDAQAELLRGVDADRDPAHHLETAGDRDVADAGSAA